MWWLAVPAVVGAAAVIWSIFDDDAKEAQQRWHTARQEAQRTVEECRSHIEENLAEAQESYDFHFLTDLHFSSFRIADHAYSLLSDSRVSLDAMNRMLVEAKTKRAELKERKKRASSSDERGDLNKEIQMINELRNAVFPQKDALKQQRNDFHAEVKRLNRQTHRLKVAIRDRCGIRGQEWYERLEARKAARG